MKTMMMAAVVAAGLTGVAAPTLTIPKMTTAPTIDGVFAEGEWARAGQYNRFCRLHSAEAFNHNGYAYVGRDDANLYIAVATQSNPLNGLVRNLKPTGRNQRNAFWDDSLDFDFISDMRTDSPSISHYCSNFDGAFFVTARRDGKQVNWLPEGFVCKSTEKDGWWFYELKVPFASIDYKPAPDRVFGLRIARNWHYVLRSSLEDSAFGVQTSIADNDATFESAGGATTLVFDDEAPVVQQVAVGGTRGDQESVSYPVTVRVTNVSGRPRKFDVSISGRAERSKPGQVTETLTLAPGETKDVTLNGAVLGDEKIDLVTRVSEGEKVYFDRHLVFRQNYEPIPWASRGGNKAEAKLRFGHFPSYRLIHATADVAYFQDRPKAAQVVWTLRNAKAGVVATTNSVLNEAGLSEIYWNVPDLKDVTTKSGSPDYTLGFTVSGLDKAKAEQPFKREVFPWEGNDIGLSNTVPPPFEQVRREEGRGKREEVVKVVLREHVVDKTTGLWKQVTAKGHDLLARPMALVSGNRTIEQSEQSNNLSASAEWDFDGYMEWTLTLKPGHHEPMYLEIPVKASEAKLMHAVTDSVGYNYAGKVPAGKGRVWDSTKAPGGKDFVNDFIPYVWIGGCLRGVSVTADNDRGWIEKTKEEGTVPCYEIVREDDGTVVLRLNLVQKAVDLKDPSTIRLGFMATPVKPMVPHWRSHSIGELFGSNIYWGGLIEALEPYDEQDTFWLKMAEARRTGDRQEEYYDKVMAEFPFDGAPGSEVRKFCENRYRHHYRAGLRMAASTRFAAPAVFYTNPRGMELGGRAATTFCDEWNRQVYPYPSHVFGRHAKRDYDVDPCLSYRDYAAWCYKRMVQTRACDYLYWDCTFPSCNLNLTPGTKAYVRPDGSVQGDAGVSNMRAVIRRCAVMQAENGYESRFNWAHMTNTGIAPMLSFAGINFDWEDASDTTTFQDRYGIDHILAGSTGRQFGNIVNMLAFYKGNTKEENERLGRCGAGVMLAFEFRWRWNCTVWRETHAKICKWGYRLDDTLVWNFWDEDVRFPVEIAGPTNAALAMARLADDSGTACPKREALVIVSDFADGGEYRVKPDAAAMCLKDGFRAYDFESGAELPFKDGAATVTIPKHDFRIVEFR